MGHYHEVINDEKSCREDAMQSEKKAHEYKKRGFSPDTDHLNCEQCPEVRS